jgi:ribonuclease HII
VEPFEKRIRRRGFSLIAGVDESGRGPLAGPVVAGAVVLPPGSIGEGIKDSKQLTAGQREKAFSLIMEKALGVGVGIVDVEEIDRINILQASLKAMRLAVENLPFRPDFLLVDGLHGIDLPYLQETIVRGDERCLSIAAASIVAKVSRDRLMIEYDRAYPDYHFARNKGYGTKEHIAAIQRKGCCPIHRQSFRIIYQPSLI